MQKIGSAQNGLPNADDLTKVVILPNRAREDAEMGERVIRVSEEEIDKYGGSAKLFYRAWVKKNGYPKHTTRFHNGVLIIKLARE